MSFSPAPSNGSLNGTTVVTIVSAPASGKVRMVRGIRIVNLDTVAQTIVGKLVDSGGNTSTLFSLTIAAGAMINDSNNYELAATTQSITAVMAAGATTTQPSYIVAYADKG